MTANVMGPMIRKLRESKGYTQKQLGELVSVSDKTVSKWELCRGLPDVSLLEPLAAALEVSVAELMAGECVANRNRSGNMLRMKFYICPACGNVIWSAGEGVFSCCGIQLSPLKAEEADAAHALSVEILDGEYYVCSAHPMEKEHYMTFLARVTTEKAEVLKLYPEQPAEGRFSVRGGGVAYACCNRHGLVRIKLPAPPRKNGHLPKGV